MHNKFLFFNSFNNDESDDTVQQDNAETTVSPDCGDGSVTVLHNGKLIHCLTIIGQIEGHYNLPANNKTTKYEHMIPRIVAVEQNPDISGLLLLLNTVGGDIEAGLAIAELISGMSKPTVSLVLGGSHSIGIPLAVSTNCSYIVPTASMTVHPVRMNGLIIGVPQSMIYLKKMEQRVLDFVHRNSSVTKERFKELMTNNNELVSDFGTVLSGEEAVAEGIIDKVGSLKDAFSYFDDIQ